jgi:hypothetical protein
MKKAQSTIIGFILITAIAVVIISATMFWASPLIERAQDQQEVNRMEQKFLELHQSIKKVASEQGALSLPFDISKGVIALNSNNNTINYQGQFNVVQPTPRKLIFGNNTPADVSATPTAAEIVPLGIEEPAYLFEQGAVEFNLHYRIVNDSGSCHQIKLLPGGQAGAGAGSHTIRLIWEGENISTTIPGGCSSLTEQLVEFNVE